MLAHLSHIRRIYSRPWRDGSLANPGKVSTCIQVGVRPQTTLFAHETMSEACSHPTAAATSLARVSRINILNRDSDSPRLILDELLQLPKRPAMQTRAHAPARLDARSDVGQVLHGYFGDPNRTRLSDDGLARFVVDVIH